MAPVAQGDMEFESHTSDLDSPLRRQFSEPIHARSTSTQASPSPSPMESEAKCNWCGQSFEPNDDPVAQNEAFKEHVASVHPHAVRSADDDDTGDEQAEDEPSAVADEIENGDEAEDEEHEDDLAENGLADGVETTEIDDENANSHDIDGDEHEAEGDGDGDIPEGESDLALAIQLHEFSRQQDSVSLDERVDNLWNIHDIHLFSQDYDDKIATAEKTWASVFHELKRTSKKRDASGEFERPNPYQKTKAGRGEFLELTPTEEFLTQLRDPELRSSDELFAITENVAYALKAWQDEYVAIEKLHRHATRHLSKQTSDPRKFDRPGVYEDKKEAMLYNYKYDPKEDKIGHQNPFLQGGFKPTPAQYRKMVAKHGLDNPNPDGWPTITKFGVEHIPKFQNPTREEVAPKATRKRKAAEIEAAKANETDEATAESPAPADEEDVHPAKRRTRARRAAAEAELPTRTSARGRGRGGRGRGGTRLTYRADSETPQPPTAAPTRTAPRSSGRAAGREAIAPKAGPPQPQSPTAAAQPTPIKPAPTQSVASLVRAQMEGVANGSMDAAELARREKIANSKNPKRTEAMLNHWARFNKEGRTRNPKRSKAQIEADRIAEASKRATEPPKLITKKKRSHSPVFGAPPRPEPGLAPAPHMPASTPLPPLAPIPAPRPSMTFAPISDPLAMTPFPPAPRGPLQQPPPPPQPYRTPYPDYTEYYSPYGPPTAPLPPPAPSHMRPA